MVAEKGNLVTCEINLCLKLELKLHVADMY